jgi:hypothetical protein
VRRRTRAVVAAFLGTVVVACGIDAIGTYVTPLVDPDAAADGPILERRDGAGLDATQQDGEILLDGQPIDGPIGDGGLDVNPANCLKVCEGGTCNEAGACAITCPGSPACQPDTRIVCPPGVPCEVSCTAQSACNRGVDCSQASRCAINCTAQDTCNEMPNVCAGDTCTVTCSGQTSCNRSVSCDAGTCAIKCTGNDSCNENTVVCNAATACTVQCGVGGSTGQGACNRSVSCVAKESCSISCLSQDSCAENPVRAIADRAGVVCSGQTSCNRGVFTSAGDSGILCKSQDSCAVNGINCDGGRCRAACEGTGGNPIKNCCKAASCAVSQVNCTFTATGCPP